MIGIIRYLKGYVKIRVWGYSPERFMNLCTNRGIFLWGLSGDGSYYTMYMSLSDYFTIRDIVKKTKTRAAVLERHGLPFFFEGCPKEKSVSGRDRPMLSVPPGHVTPDLVDFAGGKSIRNG